MKETVKVEPGIGSVPEINTQYWYIRSNYMQDHFVVQETEWVGGISDLFRLAKGNVYLTEKEANEVATTLNDRLDSLKSISENARQREMLLEEKARKKAEAAERKRLREESKRSLDQKEREQQYENNKKKREAKKKSPHPDIIV